MSKQYKDTRVHLVEELRKLPAHPAIEDIIREALAGQFHDYKNDKYACGKVESYRQLREAAALVPDGTTTVALIALSERIKDGEFDEHADEEDKAEMRKMLPQKAWHIFGL
jgi:hypothetical protein